MAVTDPAFAQATAETSPHLRFGLSHRDSIQNYFAWQARQFAASGKVLDHGAGSGALAVALLRQGVRSLVALEPEAELAGQMRARFAGEPSVEVFQGTAEDYLKHAGPGSIDSVVTSNVLEHISDDSACLRTIFELLSPGGKLGVYVPARMELFGSLDDAVGHVRRYHAPELRDKLTRARFVIDELRYCNLLGVLPWFVAGRVLKRATVGGESHRLFDRVFPICAAIEQRLGLPYGLNLLALARKPL
ncbi:MAG TPA: methyltransferase domain-containing protein [Polyangiaceae bacterium]|jgi:SAM-dependent methyltransferase|nr:methyltransferase domain-containing protein [Polyangiaceae bacterium]